MYLFISLYVQSYGIVDLYYEVSCLRLQRYWLSIVSLIKCHEVEKKSFHFTSKKLPRKCVVRVDHGTCFSYWFSTYSLYCFHFRRNSVLTTTLLVFSLFPSLKPFLLIRLSHWIIYFLFYKLIMLLRMFDVVLPSIRMENH